MVAAARDYPTSCSPGNPFHYSVVVPFAQYSPWLEDAEFLNIKKSIQDYTIIDQYRLYELWSLCAQLTSVSGDVLEVGVWRGGSQH